MNLLRWSLSACLVTLALGVSACAPSGSGAGRGVPPELALVPTRPQPGRGCGPRGFRAGNFCKPLSRP